MAIRQINPATFGPDGETIDAVALAQSKATNSCHEAIERGDWQQVIVLARCLSDLEKTLGAVRFGERRR